MSLKTPVYGRADIPLSDDPAQDHLGMRRYAEALAKFVLGCETPMTVGIQGEWGSGKTSLMRMVQRAISGGGTRRDAQIFEFETWQYGAIERVDSLGFVMMRSVLRKIAESSRGNESILYRIAMVAGRVGTVLAKAGAKGAIGALGQGMIDADATIAALTPDGPGTDETTELAQVKKEFARIVWDITGGEKGRAGRVIIFIDDLDRIRPDRAVALLEVMKNFMDVERCVFVLACDYDVVRRGVAGRLGIEEPEKAEAFFHKIIQVPFSMPTHSYEIDSMIDQFMTGRVSAKRRPEYLSQMVHAAIGSNPRSLKRFFNRFDLHACLDIESSGTMTVPSFVGLTALVAMQMRWPRIAAHIAKKRRPEDVASILMSLAHVMEEDVESDILEILRDEYGGSSGDWHGHHDVIRLQRFADIMVKCLDTGGDGKLSTTELGGLLRHAAALSVTSVEVERGGKATGAEDDEWRTFEVHRSGVRVAVLERLIAQLWNAERRNLKNLSMVNNGPYFQVRVKAGGELVLAVRKDSGAFVVHLGSKADTRYPDYPVIAEIAAVFRDGCSRNGVKFVEQRNGTSCNFDLGTLDGAREDDFLAVVFQALRAANMAFGVDVESPGAGVRGLG